jgi:hypothetical protein
LIVTKPKDASKTGTMRLGTLRPGSGQKDISRPVIEKKESSGTLMSGTMRNNAKKASTTKLSSTRTIRKAMTKANADATVGNVQSPIFVSYSKLDAHHTTPQLVASAVLRYIDIRN